MAAMPPPGQQPEMWELRLGQYVNCSLTLAEYRSLVAGWATWPQLPTGYKGPAFTYAYLEAVEGECATGACWCGVGSVPASLRRRVGWQQVRPVGPPLATARAGATSTPPLPPS